MPANLTPEFLKAREAFSQAKTTSEKIAALEEMLATIPKHKGTDHMVGDIRRRLSNLRNVAEKRGAKGVDVFYIERQGAGQVVLLGVPNAGKSALVSAATHARPAVADYPFTTQMPLPGMMPFEDIQIQLVDMPAITADYVPPGMIGTLRAADIVLVCVDVSSANVAEQLDICLDAMHKRGLVAEGEELPEEGGISKKVLIAGLKADARGAKENFAALQKHCGQRLSAIAASAETREGLDALARKLFEMLNVVRVYSKEPGKKAELDQPFILPVGSTVLDMAQAVHGELAKELRFARIWGSGRFDGQQVQREHVLADKDVIELHGGR